MFGERIFGTFILAALGLTLMGVVRPSSPDPTEDVLTRQSSFFINKAHQKNKFDVVIVGDSRALRGLSPDEVAKQLPGKSVFNFAFNAGGMNYGMYEAAENLLDLDSTQPTIILTPTSLAFMPEKKNNSQYLEYLAKPRDQVWLHSEFPAFTNFFQPLSPSVFLRRWLHIQPPRVLIQDFHHNGWIATNQTPKNDVNDLTALREVLLLSGSIDHELVADFMKQTKEWLDEGIAVYALYPPAYQPRVDLEERISGFDRVKFRQDFENAGGVWLEVSSPDYVTYDGSHLVKESALSFSRKTGLMIAKHIQP